MNPRFAPSSENFPAGKPLNSNLPFSDVMMDSNFCWSFASRMVIRARPSGCPSVLLTTVPAIRYPPEIIVGGPLVAWGAANAYVPNKHTGIIAMSQRIEIEQTFIFTRLAQSAVVRSLSARETGGQPGPSNRKAASLQGHDTEDSVADF